MQGLITRSSPWIRNDSDVYFNNGNVGIGTTTPSVPVEINATTTSMIQARWTDSAGSGAGLTIRRSRGASVGADTVVVDGDHLGAIGWQGYDGATFISAAQISVYVDGTPGVGDMPGRMVFMTTADSASVPTERMRIDSNGNVGIGTSALPSGGGTPVLALAVASGDPTGIGANTAGIFVKDVAASGELHAFDEAGNVSLLSPHDPMTNEWVFESRNLYSGKTIRVDMEKLAKAVEVLTGQTFVTEGMLPAGEIQDWDANQLRLVTERDDQIVAYNALPPEEQGDEPEVYVAKPKPAFFA